MKLFVAIPFEEEGALDIEMVSIAVSPGNARKVAESLKKAYGGKGGFQFIPPLEAQIRADIKNSKKT